MTYPLATRVRWVLDYAATAWPAEPRELMRELRSELERLQKSQSSDR
jgi:hypothetical protein